jgi:type VI secretion system Hcp family effector
MSMRHTNAFGKVILGISFALVLGAPLAANADIIALQMPNIPGDAKFAANNGLPLDSIRVLTVGNSVENSAPPISGGGGSGKAVFSSLSLVKKFGESSAPLFLVAAQGRHLQTATISFYRVKQGVPAKYYTITLEDVVVAAQKWVGNSNGVDAADSESLELAYNKITLLDNETGSRACYDISRNVAC